MKQGILIMIISAMFIGCNETTVQPASSGSDVFSNDLLHGDIVGTVMQKESRAKVIISQINPIDSASINPADGSFIFRDLRAGNYIMRIIGDNYRTYKNEIMVRGGTITYVGDIKLSTTPDLVSSFYPENNSEIVHDWRYGRIAISIYFDEPMDRVSVEQAFSTNPASEGIFYWGTYTYAPYNALYSVSYNYGSPEYGATITTYDKIRAVTYVLAKKDAYTDTMYTITLSTAAHDTAGNYLKFPLQFSFRTVQSYYTIYGIQTSPIHGDIDVEPLTYGGIILTFPRRMNPASTEAATTISPSINRIFLWPEENVLRIYPGGPLLCDTTFTITVAGTALDKDGVQLGTPFTFSFRTAPFRLSSTNPENAEVFVSPSQSVYLNFNSYVIKSYVETSFSISPSVGGTFYYGGTYSYEIRNQIIFTPSSALQPNIKYTVELFSTIKDLYGVAMKAPFTFSFVTRPD